MSDNDKVVFLKYRHTTVEDSKAQWCLACTPCKNRTWVMRCDSEHDYPHLVCAACGNDAGKLGWVQS